MLRNSCEDVRDSLRVKLVGVHHVEVSDDPGGYMGSTSSRLPQGSQQQNILNFHELLIFSVVPSIVVHELPQKFNRRLGFILFFLGHIQIINKNYVFFANWCSIDSSFYFL